MDLFITLLIEFGLPVASATVMGIFIYIILKYILDSVISQVNTMHGIIMGLDNRIKTMNNDMVRIDLSVSSSLGLAPDLDRVARAENFVEDGTIDVRRD